MGSAPLDRGGRVCEYCDAPEFRKHEGFCLTNMEGAREQWRNSGAERCDDCSRLKGCNADCEDLNCEHCYCYREGRDG